MLKTGLSSKNKNSGYALVDKILWLIVLLVVCLMVIFLIKNATAKPTSTVTAEASSTSGAGASDNTYSTLSPANVPSKTAECNQKVTFSSNGSSSPITCSNGDLNVQEWDSLSSLEPKVMTLGYGATASQVQSTLCTDVHNNISNLIEEENYQISVLYYGWSFSSNPSTVLTNGTCENVDD